MFGANRAPQLMSDFVEDAIEVDLRERASPISMRASRERWLGVMSTVEKTYPVT